MTGLTDRQREMLFTYARLGDQEAAAKELGVALSTLKNTLDTVHRKLGTRSSLTALWMVLRDE